MRITLQDLEGYPVRVNGRFAGRAVIDLEVNFHEVSIWVGLEEHIKRAKEPRYAKLTLLFKERRPADIKIFQKITARFYYGVQAYVLRGGVQALGPRLLTIMALEEAGEIL
jgi:hypothetical protein